jgi:hypothetical protein
MVAGTGVNFWKHVTKGSESVFFFLQFCFIATVGNDPHEEILSQILATSYAYDLVNSLLKKFVIYLLLPLLEPMY